MLVAKSYLSSSISVPKIHVMNNEIQPCTASCLAALLDDGQIFSFLAQSNDHNVDYELREARMIYAFYFNLERITYDSVFRVAMLIPDKVIGNYATSTGNAVFAYLMAKNRSFELQTYYIDDEKSITISSALDKIKEDGFSYVIAPLTLDGATEVANINPDINIYFPTIHKSDIQNPPLTLFFGGIDYYAQIEKLLEYSQGHAALFYDPSTLGRRLNTIVEDLIDPKLIRFTAPISRNKSNLEHYLKRNDLLQNGSIFLNTSTVRSGIVMSQLTLFDIEPAAILSTQINYDPLLLSITQSKDRQNMYIANSLENDNSVLIEANTILDNDIVYDRINYATMIGVDYFLSQVSRDSREYREEIISNQVIYPITIYTPTAYGFKVVE